MSPPASLDRIPFLRLLGMTQDDAPPGQSRLHLPVLREEHCNGLAAAHGGVVMTLLDVAMARAAISADTAPTGTVVTVEMSTRFLKPARGALVATGRAISVGRSLCSCEARLHLLDGTHVASAMGTFKYWKGPLGGVE